MTPSDGHVPVDWPPLADPAGYRILNLNQGDGDQPLTGELYEFTLEDMKDGYIAISYAWETTDLTHEIICNGRLVGITANLHSALSKLRCPDRHVLIWCDALCIRQGYDSASLFERSHQISLMSRIFSSAMRVIAYLGDDDGTFEDLNAGVSMILAVDEALRDQADEQENPIEYLGLPDWRHPMWRAIQRLLSRSWFFRLWTVQEVVLAREVYVKYGDYAIRLDHFVSVAMIYSAVSNSAVLLDSMHDTEKQTLFEINRPQRACRSLWQTWKRRQLLHDGDETPIFSLCDLLISTMSQFCTDRRDRVYALYGMADHQVVKDLPVDYTETVDALTLRTSQYLLGKGHATWMLMHNGSIRASSPSWSLDLSTLGYREKFDPLTGTTQADGHSDTYSAGGSAAPSMTLDTTEHQLSVLGTIVDSFAAMPDEFVVDLPVESLLGISGNAKYTLEYTIHNMRTLRAAATFAYESHKAGLHAEDAIWRTLIADFNPWSEDHETLDPDSGRTRPGFGKYFYELLEHIDGLLNSNPPFDVHDLSHENRQRINLSANANRYWGALTTPYLQRRLTRLASGTLALVPQTSRTDDLLAVFQGVPVPFVLRNTAEDAYQVVGVCYIHGMMDGEAMKGEPRLENIVLV